VTVGIVGYGRFGRLAAAYAAKRTRVLVFDPLLKPGRVMQRRVRAGTLHEVASQQIVVLAVPVSSLRQVLFSIRKILRPATLVLDVCAVKTKPVVWLEDILPDNVSILGTHPLFGPDSAGESLQGHRVYLCPVRIAKQLLRHTIRLLKREGLVVEVVSPALHDKTMAETLFLTQYIGRLVAKTRLPRHEVSTKSYTELMKMVAIADNDSRELFADMLNYNPYARKVWRRLQHAQTTLPNDFS
jgi:prephenate dehydrogenase